LDRQPKLAGRNGERMCKSSCKENVNKNTKLRNASNLSPPFLLDTSISFPMPVPPALRSHRNNVPEIY
jgi:hypothetical protein